MSSFNSTDHPLKRKGTTQSERFPIALSSDYVKIDERTFEDLIAQTAELSKYFNYFESSSVLPEGNWTDFFIDLYDFNTKKSKISSIEELTEKANTTPHLALFLSFIKLFLGSINHLNSLGEKQLLFFYEGMLHLKANEGIAPKMTLFGEVAGSYTETFIPKNTFFKAGKNTLGEDIYYQNDEDAILNRVAVSEIKNINFLNDKITARPISNSADGNGAEFIENPKAWFPFGEKNDRLAEIGFCIASPLFLINDGDRTITVFLKNANLNDFNIFISTVDGWTSFEISTKKTVTSGDTATLIFKNEFPEIIPYDSAVHGSNLQTKFAVLKLTLKNSSSVAFDLYKKSSLVFTVTIDLKKVSNLSVQNQNGKIDVSKPFQAFGNNPENGLSELIVGHPFLFSSFLKGNISFNVPGKYSNQFSPLYYLQNGTWSLEKPRFYSKEFTGDYNVKSKNNFVKYLYAGTYSREKYVSNVINTIKDAKVGTKITITKEDIPVWKDFSVSASVEFNQTNNDIFEFYHLHSFGSVLKKNLDSLLPFYEKSSLLLIGLLGWEYGKTVSLHFEMLEGSGNQELNHPKIKWGVFSNNKLLPLTNGEIIRDTTLNLAQSGLLKFSLTKEMYDDNTILDSAKVWLVGICENDFEAIPKLIAISPQAFLATYQIPVSGVVEDIPINTITKSEVPISGLKKVLQPYKSFGGRLKEDQKSFITRASERLRHKGRAITIFDYERILLQEFPFVYLVKCVSHSNSSTEMAPGSVLIILLPKLKKDHTQNLLKPTVSLGNRVLIKNYLQKITSPFVTIEVRNPTYKEISVELFVRYLPQFAGDKDHYNSVLNLKLREYISPWLLPEGEITFNKEGFISSYINYIEELDFVDYITNFKIYVDGKEIKNKITAGKEDVIFTSAEDHIIKNEELC